MDSALCEIARKHLKAATSSPYFGVWIPLLVKLDPKAGIEALEKRVELVVPSQLSEAVALIGSLFDERPATH